MRTSITKIFLGLLLSVQAIAAPAIIWQGVSAQLLPPSLHSAGVCSLDANGVLSSTAPGSAGTFLISNGSAWVSGAGSSGHQEVPSGSINGSNTSFSLTAAPNYASTFSLYKNGLILNQGVDYSISGTAITMATAPLYGETLYATYAIITGGGSGGVSSLNGATGAVTIAAGSNISVSTAGGTITISGSASSATEVQEVPSGIINSSNTTYTLANTPVSNASVKLYLDGIFQRQGTNYTISGSTITMSTAPTTGQQLDADYAH